MTGMDEFSKIQSLLLPTLTRYLWVQLKNKEKKFCQIWQSTFKNTAGDQGISS